MRVALLVVLWLLAWGEFSLANLLSGIAVATAVLVAFPPSRRRHGDVHLNAIGLCRLAGYIVTQLVASNAVMARHILSPRPDVRPAVIAHRLRHPSEEAITVMTTVIALSPGTMTVDVDQASTTIYVHFFRLVDIDAAREQIARLEELVSGALGRTASRELAPRMQESP